MKRRFLPVLALLIAALPSACAHDRDDNPPGRVGGPGTNWENPPGPVGGPGASPDRRVLMVRSTQVRVIARPGGYYYHPRYGYWHGTYGWWNQAAKCWYDRDDNPPGRAGGRGTNWENPPGLKGGPGASPDRYGRCR
ncbi:MAG: hypothetical protein AAFY82_08740 [Pseudomonadota bacterium]